jgi:hypothetical protein
MLLRSYIGLRALTAAINSDRSFVQSLLSMERRAAFRVLILDSSKIDRFGHMLLSVPPGTE